MSSQLLQCADFPSTKPKIMPPCKSEAVSSQRQSAEVQLCIPVFAAQFSMLAGPYTAKIE